MLPSECHSDNLIADVNTIGHSCSKGDLGSYGIVTNRVFDPIGQDGTTAKSNELSLVRVFTMCRDVTIVYISEFSFICHAHPPPNHSTDITSDLF